jgi:ribosomal protein S18 acetylase RimI-like enzyme
MNAPTDCAAATVRRAVPADAPGIAEAFLDSAEHHARLDPLRYRIPPLQTIVDRYGTDRQASDAPSSLTLVAELGGDIVGFVEVQCEASPDPMHKDVTFCHVRELAVKARHRGRGIGAQLLCAAEDWGRRHGAAFALLEYHAANTRAGGFYHRRMGYTVAAITAIKPL